MLAVVLDESDGHLSHLLTRVPLMREMSRLVSRACAALAELGESAPSCNPSTLIPEAEKPARSSAEHGNSSSGGMEELGRNRHQTGREGTRNRERRRAKPRKLTASEARVARIVGMIESRPDEEFGLRALAREAKLNPYHFLRMFHQFARLTPHQYIWRARLRRAATRLMLERARVLDIAFESGFGDVSNFNHAFRAEFGMNPRSYRKKCMPRTSER